MTEHKIRVLIVDDSSLMREALRSILSDDPQIEVIAMAKDGGEGVDKALALKPDVITMDLKMPVMSGLEAIEKIMEESPIPIIVVSSQEVPVIVKALGVGAMDFVSVSQDIDLIARDLVEKIKIASHIRPLKRMKIRPILHPKVCITKGSQKLVVIGASTGGPQALMSVLSKLPKDFPAAIMVVQHMSKGFIQGLAEWLMAQSELNIKIASAGDETKSGTVLIAPDDYNMKIDRLGKVVLNEDVSKTMLHVPSIDSLMLSAAESFGKDAVGVIMTGMGTDGLEGMKAIKKAGGITIAQDEKTSAVFGMNKACIDAGCVDTVAPVENVAEILTESL